MSYALNNFSKTAHCARLMGMAIIVQFAFANAKNAVVKGALSPAVQLLTFGNRFNHRHRTRNFEFC
jgi:hypothetical protein